MPDKELQLFRGSRVLSALLMIPAVILAIPFLLFYTIKILVTQWRVLVRIIRHVAEDPDN